MYVRLRVELICEDDFCYYQDNASIHIFYIHHHRWTNGNTSVVRRETMVKFDRRKEEGSKDDEDFLVTASQGEP